MHRKGGSLRLPAISASVLNALDLMANSRTEAVPFITARILCYHMSHKASYQYLGIRWIKRCCKWSADWKINKQSSKRGIEKSTSENGIEL